MRPTADLHNLDIVQVLTAARGTLPSNLSRLAVSLPVGQGGAAGGPGEQLASTSGE